MIITCTRHGRQPQDAVRLAAHLTKTAHQAVTIVGSSGLTPQLSLHAALADMRRSLALSLRAEIGFHHITVNPATLWTAAQRNEAVRQVLAELGATDHAWIAVEHSAKARAAPSSAAAHVHLVVAHVGPNGKALDIRHSYARLEAVARSLEFDLGESLTASRRPAAVIARLRRAGREDVAAALDAAATGARLPRSAMTSSGRHRAAREGFDLPSIRAVVRAAWSSPDMVTVLAANGLRIGTGDRTKAPVIKTADGLIVGAVDRMAHASRADVLARLEFDMARRKKPIGDGNEQHTAGRNPDARPPRSASMARRGRDESHGGHDPRPVERVGRVARPRLVGPNRGHAEHAPHDPAAAQRRRRRALIELRLADAAARVRASGGRKSADDVLAVKAKLWKRLFGADLSPGLVAALHHIDMRERVVRVTSGGWVRDEGDKVLASGADPAVVALLVEAAKGKGWQSVRVWGAPEFIQEAKRQFEEAGILVAVGDPPPVANVAPWAPPTNDPATSLADEFQRRRDTAKRMLSDLQKPGDEPAELQRARATEAGMDDSWRAAFRGLKDARAARSKAAAEVETAGIFGRSRARQAMADADRQLEEAKDSLNKAEESHARAKDRTRDLVKRHQHAERLRVANSADQARRLLQQQMFAEACLTALKSDPALALNGAGAVEDAARALVAKQAANRGRRSEREEQALQATKP